MKKRKKIAVLLSCLVYSISLASWNVSDYKPYTLKDFKTVRAAYGGAVSELRNFPNTVVLYKKKGLPLDIMIPNAFEYYKQGHVGFAVHTPLVEGDGVEGVRMDIISYSDIKFNRRYNGRTYYSIDGDKRSVPITARYWINNEIDKSLEIPIYWEARKFESPTMTTTQQKLVVKIPLQLKAFDIDLGQVFVNDSSNRPITTSILVDGEANSTVILDLGSVDSVITNSNGTPLPVRSLFLGSGSSYKITVELGPNGEERVELMSLVGQTPLEPGRYTGSITITAKYI